MADLSSGVEKILENPTSGEDISLIVSIDRGDTDEVVTAIEAAGGVVEMIISNEDLAVTIDERALSEVCELERVESVEVEGTGRVLDSGDFQSPAG